MLCYLLQSGTIQKAKNMPTHPHTHIYTYTPSTKETCQSLFSGAKALLGAWLVDVVIEDIAAPALLRHCHCPAPSMTIPHSTQPHYLCP